jgi:hypothetical protein
MFAPGLGLARDNLDVHGIYIPEMAVDVAAEAARLKGIMDRVDNVNIFISEGAGVESIVAEKEITFGAATDQRCGDLVFPPGASVVSINENVGVDELSAHGSRHEPSASVLQRGSRSAPWRTDLVGGADPGMLHPSSTPGRVNSVSGSLDASWRLLLFGRDALSICLEPDQQILSDGLSASLPERLALAHERAARTPRPPQDRLDSVALNGDSYPRLVEVVGVTALFVPPTTELPVLNFRRAVT